VILVIGTHEPLNQEEKTVVRRIPPRAQWLPLRMARLFLRPNELRRSSDRLEAVVVAGLAAAFAVTVVLTALLAAYVYHAEQAAAPTGQRLASAVLAPPGAFDRGNSYSHQATAWATWRLSDGAARSGTLTSATAPGLYGEPSGATVPVWLDAAGDPVPPPEGAFDWAVNAVLAGLAVLVAVAAVLASCYLLCRRALDRYRLAGWGSAWAVTGPRWTRRQ
jgi:hypothetical protein